MNTDILRELGEWAALGFYEGADMPWPRAYGLAMRRLYENMEVCTRLDRLLAPFEPLPHSRTATEHGTWYAEALICDFDHNRGLRVNRDTASRKKSQFPQHANFVEMLTTDLEPRLPHFGGYTHSNPDMRRIVDVGFVAIERELDDELAAVGDEPCSPRDLLLAVKDYAIGVRAFHSRIVEAARDSAVRASGVAAQERSIIACAWDQGAFLKPANSFVAGLLAVNLTWMLDGCDSIGRFDQVLGTLFERDLQCGHLDIELARRLLDELFANFERFNGWNMQIGGYTATGKDGVNELTREIIAACGRNHLRRPNVALRITKDTPPDLLIDAIEVLKDGSGRPALYNDDLYIQALLDANLGLTLEDAREIGFGGCTETMIAGLSNVGSLEGEINLAKALELALNDGFDPVIRSQSGPHTGAFEEFETFDEFLSALKRQIQYATDTLVFEHNRLLRLRFECGDPKLYRTLFTRDCITNRKSFEAGGARYNWAVVSYQGIANTIDSLAALRACIFEHATIGKRELTAALAADFHGYSALRSRLRGAPKFGNDCKEVDDTAGDLLRFAWQTLHCHETPRGGRYIASCILFATYGDAGKRVGALPDGRRSGQVLTDSVGPAQGRDVHGPTAMLTSVAALPLHLAAGTPVLNIRLSRDMLDSAGGLDVASSLIRAYFASGGMQIQLSAVSKDEMLAAQREPDKHGDLIVRIGGYSEHFTKLSRDLQNSMIARTEYS